jgi:hypothetical protein
LIKYSIKFNLGTFNKRLITDMKCMGHWWPKTSNCFRPLRKELERFWRWTNTSNCTTRWCWKPRMSSMSFRNTFLRERCKNSCLKQNQRSRSRL